MAGKPIKCQKHVEHDLSMHVQTLLSTLRIGLLPI